MRSLISAFSYVSSLVLLWSSSASLFVDWNFWKISILWHTLIHANFRFFACSIIHACACFSQIHSYAMQDVHFRFWNLSLSSILFAIAPVSCQLFYDLKFSFYFTLKSQFHWAGVSWCQRTAVHMQPLIGRKNDVSTSSTFMTIH